MYIVFAQMRKRRQTNELSKHWCSVKIHTHKCSVLCRTRLFLLSSPSLLVRSQLYIGIKTYICISAISDSVLLILLLYVSLSLCLPLYIKSSNVLHRDHHICVLYVTYSYRIQYNTIHQTRALHIAATHAYDTQRKCDAF